MDQAEVDCLAANAYIELALRMENSGRAMAHAEQAEQHTLNARNSRAQGYDRSRILDEIRLAKVRLAQHDLIESVTVAQSALALAAPTSSTVVCDWLLRFHSELTARYPHDVHVLPFSEQLREYVKQIAPQKECKGCPHLKGLTSGSQFQGGNVACGRADCPVSRGLRRPAV